jgi:hypothetical protein
MIKEEQNADDDIANIMIQTGQEEEKLERAIKKMENLGM